MKPLHEGLDYKLYKIYVWGGLPLIVIYIVVAVFLFDTPPVPGSRGFLVTIGPMFIWFFGILFYWWWVFLIKENKEFKEQLQSQVKGTPEISSLKDWSTLHQAMSISGGDIEELSKNNKKANRSLIIWYGSMNLLPIWIFGFITLGSMGIIPGSYFPIMVYGVVIWIVVMIFGTPLLFRWGRKTAEFAYLAPLGLAITRLPKSNSDEIDFTGDDQKLISDGSVIFEGERYGRLVHIQTSDKYSLTVLKSTLPDFTVASKEGKLTPGENAPDQVVSAIKSLRKAKRWRGINVFAGSNDITIQRESKGANMWLYDLWLAEYLLDKISSDQT